MFKKLADMFKKLADTFKKLADTFKTRGQFSNVRHLVFRQIDLVDTLYVDFSSKLVIILAAALLIFNGVLYWSGTYPFSNVSSLSSIPAFKANDNRIVLASLSALVRTLAVRAPSKLDREPHF